MPTDNINQSYWTYNRAKPADIDSDLSVVDFTRGLTATQKEKVRPVKTVSSRIIREACQAFQDASKQPHTVDDPQECVVYEHTDLPGLLIYTRLLPPETQLLLLSQVMHRDLANPHHKTNINADYDTTYPATPSPNPDTNLVPSPSFFSRRLNSNSPEELFTPKDASVSSKPLYTNQVLSKKLRWLTLGDQYDWPTRSYSGKDETSFPTDISRLVSGLFPALNAQSGVVLLYSAKDFMPVHRDVSEQCERGLASFTLGCDGLFTIVRDTAEGEENNHIPIVLRVRSGDVLELSGEARWAWHA